MIDFGKTNSSARAPRSGANNNDQPKATLWLNVGYYVDAPTDEDPTARRFVSLPVGIPVDTQELIKANSSNSDFRAFQSARNDLLASLIAAGSEMEPGAEVTLDLEIQLRRVNEEAAPVETADNRYARPLTLVKAA